MPQWDGNGMTLMPPTKTNTPEMATRIIDGNIFVYDSSEIYRLALSAPINMVKPTDFDLTKMFWFANLEQASVFEVLEHFRRIMAVSVEDPIVLAPDGSVLDGLHRIARAVLDNRSSIPARQLLVEPEPICIIPVHP